MALKWLRDQMKYLTWILWIIVAAFMFALFFDFRPGGFGSNSTRVAATVGSEQITYEEFGRQYQNLENRYRQMFGQQWTSDMAKQFNLGKQALDQLIDQRILLMEADRVGLRATDDEVRDAILEIPAFKDENGDFIGREKVKQLLAANRLTDADFSAMMRQDVVLSKFRRILADTLYVSNGDLEAAYRDQNEKAAIQYVQVTGSQFSADVTVNDEELKAYYDEHSSDYQIAEQRVVDYVLVDAVKMRREIEIPDADLQQYWEKNPDEFKREEQVRARHILLRTTPQRDAAATESELLAIKARIVAGEDFATLARELSDDDGSAQRGGSLGFFGRGAMIEPFDKAAFDAEPGTLVGPVRTDYGFHLIEVQEHREGGVQPFEEAKPVITSRLVGERVDQLAQDKINDISQRIRNESLKESAQLEALATEEGVTFQTSQPFGQDDAVVGIGRAVDFNAAAFALATGDISQPVKVPRGWVIIHLAEIKAPHVPELADVEALVRATVATEKQKRVALEKLQQARDAASEATLGEGQSVLALVAEKLGAEVKDSGEFGRLGTVGELGRNRGVIDAALSMDEGAISNALATDDGAVLFEVQSRTTFDPTTFAEAEETTREQEVNKRVEQLLASLIEERKRDLAPKYDAQVVQDFDLQSANS